MNQLEALRELVIYVREQEPDDAKVLRALKWADKRLDTLQDRAERRKVPIPVDLCQEPLIINALDVYADLKGTVCLSCGKKKRARASFCTTCYIAIPNAGVKKALWAMDYYVPAFNRAVRLLREMREAA